jgi:hypothetical protein
MQMYSMNFFKSNLSGDIVSRYTSDCLARGPGRLSGPAPFEAEMCGIRSAFRSAEDLDTLHPSLRASTVPEVHTGLHEEGTVLLFSSQWWHSTSNLTPKTFQISNKFSNVRVYNEAIHLQKIERDKEKAARGLPEEYCSVKTEQNILGTLMWSHSFFTP